MTKLLKITMAWLAASALSTGAADDRAPVSERPAASAQPKASQRPAKAAEKPSNEPRKPPKTQPKPGTDSAASSEKKTAKPCEEVKPCAID